jgi:hypothetical protein
MPMTSTRSRTTSPTRARLRAVPPTTPSRNAPDKFDARTVLKRTGFRISDEARAARPDVKRAASALSGIGSTDVFGNIGGFALAIIGSILGLVLIDLLISPRGSTLTGDTVSWISSGIGRLISPTDPIVGGGQTATTASAAAGSPAAAASAPAPSAAAQASERGLYGLPPTVSSPVRLPLNINK